MSPCVSIVRVTSDAADNLHLRRVACFLLWSGERNLVSLGIKSGTSTYLRGNLILLQVTFTEYWYFSRRLNIIPGIVVVKCVT